MSFSFSGCEGESGRVPRISFPFFWGGGGVLGSLSFFTKKANLRFCLGLGLESSSTTPRQRGHYPKLGVMTPFSGGQKETPENPNSSLAS